MERAHDAVHGILIGRDGIVDGPLAVSARLCNVKRYQPIGTDDQLRIGISIKTEGKGNRDHIRPGIVNVEQDRCSLVVWIWVVGNLLNLI